MTLEIQKISPVQYPAWDEYVLRHPACIAWHLTAWNDVLQRVYRPEFLPYAALEGGKIRGVLPLYHGKTPSGRAYLISVPYAVAGGIVADDTELAGRLVAKAIELAGELQLHSVTLKQYKHKMPGELRCDENYFNRETDLTAGEDQVWNELDAANKRAIESRGRSELALEFPSTDLNTFYHFLLRHHQLRGIPCPGPNWIEALQAGGMTYQIALLRRGGTAVAATLTKEFRDTVSFPYSSTWDMSAESFGNMYVLYWKLLQHYIQNRFAIFHSGRIPQTGAVDAFRLGWGGEKHNYYYQYYPNTTVRTEYAKKRGLKRKIAEACFKRMPGFVLRRIGPKIVANFP